MRYLGVGISVKDSPAAVELYKAAFGLELGYHVKNQDGTYYHSELLRDGQPFCSVVEAGEPKHTEGNPIELGVTFQAREELERALAVLQEGGKVTMGPGELPWSPWAAGVTDRFGLNWFLSLPQHRPAEDWIPEK